MDLSVYVTGDSFALNRTSRKQDLALDAVTKGTSTPTIAV